MKTIKRLLLILVGLLTTLVAAALFIAANIDPNDYKQEIQAAAERATGRKLHIEGDIGLTVFPTLSFDLKQVSLDNPPGFEGRFASVERVLAGLDLLPLLQKRLEIGKIVLQKPQLALYTLSDGRTNWKDLTAAGADKPSSRSSDAASGIAPALAGFSLAGLVVEDATVVWQNARTREHIRARAVTLKTGALASGKAVEFSLGGTVSDKRRQLLADLSLNASVLVDLANQRIDMQNLAAKIDLHSDDTKFLGAGINTDATIDLASVLVDLANQRIDMQNLAAKIDLRNDDAKFLGVGINTNATIDLAKDTGDFRKLAIAVGDARVESDTMVTRLFSGEPKVSATLKSNEFDLRALADTFDLTLPTVADTEAFRKFAVAGDFSADFGTDKGSAQIHRSDVTLDDSRLRTRGKIAWLPTLRVTLDSELDHVDAERYLPPDAAGGNAALGNIRISDLRTQIRAENDKINISVAQAKIFGGDFDGMLALNTGTDQAQPRWHSSGKADGVKIEQLLAALTVEDKKLLKGTGALSYKLTATGDDEKALTQSLAGSVKVELEKGAFKDPELARNVARVVAFFEKRPAGNTSKELIFNQVSASFSLKKGVADNHDLEADMPLLHLRGAGRIDLPRSRIDYQLRVALRGEKPDEYKYIPIKISGALDDPKYSVDLEKALRKEGQQQLKRKLEKEKKRVRKKLDKNKERIKEKVKEKLDDILKGTLKLPF